ncbi:hypothetical protein DV515_00017991 [Chloebia gouldiae]|uniref:Uncharacterized protein n=1 Tax=Chloebia gouldiae TaxID=44316 RepID=A0A3L8Q8R0_CHLGU|nr:hypothetical protein DV515_00017991 [Chloebia gouldiae]
MLGRREELILDLSQCRSRGALGPSSLAGTRSSELGWARPSWNQDPSSAPHCPSRSSQRKLRHGGEIVVHPLTSHGSRSFCSLGQPGRWDGSCRCRDDPGHARVPLRRQLGKNILPLRSCDAKSSQSRGRSWEKHTGPLGTARYPEGWQPTELPVCFMDGDGLRGPQATDSRQGHAFGVPGAGDGCGDTGKGSTLGSGPSCHTQLGRAGLDPKPASH